MDGQRPCAATILFVPTTRRMIGCRRAGLRTDVHGPFWCWCPVQTGRMTLRQQMDRLVSVGVAELRG